MLRLERSTDKNILEKIKNVLAEFPGNTPLVLELPENNDYKQVKTQAKVQIIPELLQKLEQLIPKENIITPVG